MSRTLMLALAGMLILAGCSIPTDPKASYCSNDEFGQVTCTPPSGQGTGVATSQVTLPPSGNDVGDPD